MHADSLAPIFLTSSVTGQGLDHVRLFFNLLACRQRWAERENDAAEFVIDETFHVQGVGTVVAGEHPLPGLAVRSMVNKWFDTF